MSVFLHGRAKILVDVEEITKENIVEVLAQAVSKHEANRREIQYLWDYYRGKQPVESREKEVRPEICNKVVINRANEIVTFKTGYLMGEPVQYVSRSEDESVINAINLLNDFVYAEEKRSKDKELADWFHICGTAFRMVLPDEAGEMDDSPFEIYTLDPRYTLVVYQNGIGQKPLMGVTYNIDSKGVKHYFCYTDKFTAEIEDAARIVSWDINPIGMINIIEYPLNNARLGAFEIVLTVLDAMNTVESNRIDGVEQVVQALLLFHNVDISSEDFEKLRERGALKYKDIDQQLKGEITYLINTLPQGETQCLTDHMYESVLTICGMPNRNGGSSTSDTGSAVIMRDGWSAAEARAKDTELMFKKSEKLLLKLFTKICANFGLMDLKVSDVEIRFTRRNYENIYQKAQVLDLMLKNPDIHPRYGFEYSGIFPDPDLAYTESQKYKEAHKEEMIQNGITDPAESTGSGENTEGTSEREQSGSINPAR